MSIKVLNEFLPNAEEARLGAIKVGDTLEINQEEGVLNVDPTSVIGRYYSNCITEIAQDVKLEIAGDNFVLKTGSRVYIPAGNNNTFSLYTTEEDIIVNGASLNDRFFLCFYTDGNNIAVRPESIDSKSGDTFPENPTNATKFYKSDENLMYRYDGDRKVWKPINISMPLAIVTFTNGIAENIIQVFNGFGYIGSTVFALPGVKGLIPNGRNADGTLKNIEHTLSKVITFERNLTGNEIPVWIRNNNTIAISAGLSYDEINNIVGTGGYYQIGFVDMNAGVISNFQPKTPFYATDYSDFKRLDNEAVKVNGNQEINDVKTFNSTLQLKNNLSFRSYGSNDSGRLQFRAQPSDNVIRGTFAITNAYSGYDGWVSQMVARSGDLSTDGFNTLRVSEKGAEYIKEEANGNVISNHKLLDTSALTNCITEIPQDIKLELVDGVLTLKAGSKVYAPNGKNADGSNKFNEIVIASDITSNLNPSQGDCFIFVQNGIAFDTAPQKITSVYSSEGVPTSNSYNRAYDYVNNHIYYRQGTDSWHMVNYSFPIAIITVDSSKNITDIKQVFNGFGYIGSTMFNLPGVKGLIPNGRNEDGSLKNTLIQSSKVNTVQLASFSGDRILLSNIVGGLGILYDLTSTLGGYNYKTNLIYRGSGAVVTGQAEVGKVVMSNGVITSFQIKTPFHAVDYNDFTPIKDAIPTKQDIATAVNYDNVTNCITEIPQDIKLELNNGTLTLKAGSKVYVPNGFESNGTTPKFDIITIQSDISYTEPSTAATTAQVFYNTGNNTLMRRGFEPASGSSLPSGFNSVFYNTSTNLCHNYTSGTQGSKVSFPICICTSNGQATNNISSIDQVFNGFGYIGSTLFALPGIKGLIPNGRNEDGTLKNTELVATYVRTTNVSGTYNFKIALATTGIGAYSYAYDAVKNAIYRADTGAYYSSDRLIAGDVSISNGKVTSLQPKTTFHAVDYNDAVLNYGNQDIGGNKNFTESLTRGGKAVVVQNDRVLRITDTTNNSTTTPTTGTNSGIVFYGKDGVQTGEVIQEFRTDGTIDLRVGSRRQVNGTWKYSFLETTILKDGTVKTKAITPSSPTANDTQIATTAWVNTKLGSQKYSTNLSYSENKLQLLDQNGDALGNSVEIKANGGSGRNVGDIFYTTRTDTSLNGAFECNGGRYATSFYNGSGSIVELLNAKKVPYVSMTEYENLVSTNGSCRAFGWDGGEMFRVPTLNDVYIEAGTALTAGEFIHESLPNITGTFNATWEDARGRVTTGAFGATNSGGSNESPNSPGSGQCTWNFDASRSSSAYQNGAKVKPDSIRYRAMVQLANEATDEALITATSALQQISNLDTNKANTSASNFNATGKSTIVSWGMPDYSRSFTISSGYTTTTNGYFEGVCASIGNYNITIGGVVMVNRGYSNTQVGFPFSIAVPKGTNITFASIEIPKFIPCKGG